MDTAYPAASPGPDHPWCSWLWDAAVAEIRLKHLREWPAHAAAKAKRTLDARRAENGRLRRTTTYRAAMRRKAAAR